MAAKDTPPAPGSLGALAAEADTLQDTTAPGAAPGEPPEPEAPRLTNAQIVGGAIAAARTVFCAVTKLDSPNQHLNDEAAQRLGAVWGPVLDKHGLDLGAVMGDWGIEIAAIAVTAEIALTLRRAVLEEIAAKNAKPVQAEEVQPSGS